MRWPDEIATGQMSKKKMAISCENSFTECVRVRVRARPAFGCENAETSRRRLTGDVCSTCATGKKTIEMQRDENHVDSRSQVT